MFTRCVLTCPLLLPFIFPRRYRWSSPERNLSHIWHSPCSLQKQWQTVFTNWKMKPFQVSSASLWTAPVAAPHWEMWHWVQAQDCRWLPLLWLKLDPNLTTGGSMLLALDRCDLCRNALRLKIDLRFFVCNARMAVLQKCLLKKTNNCVYLSMKAALCGLWHIQKKVYR